MEDRVAKIEIEIAKIVVSFEAIVKNTEGLPEILRLLAVTAERSDVNSKDISAISTKLADLQTQETDNYTSANDRANNTSRWVLGISLMYSTSLFGYFVFDMANFESDMIKRDNVVAIHEKRLVTIESRYNFLGIKDYD